MKLSFSRLFFKLFACQLSHACLLLNCGNYPFLVSQGISYKGWLRLCPSESYILVSVLFFLFFRGKPCGTPTFLEFSDGGWLNHRRRLRCLIWQGSSSEAHDNRGYCKSSVFLCTLMKFRTSSHKSLHAQFDAIQLPVTKNCSLLNFDEKETLHCHWLKKVTWLNLVEWICKNK